MRVGILGAGSWSIALSVLLHRRNHQVSLWEFNSKDAADLQANREHPLKLPGIRVPDGIEITNSINKVVGASEWLICAVPSQTTRSAMRALVKACTPEEITAIGGWIIVSKGIEVGTLQLMTDILLEEIPGLTSDKLVVLSGPSHAEEVSRNMPTTVVAASSSSDLAGRVQKEFSTETFRIYTNDDVRGVELAGAVKNVIALAAGLCDGLSLGDNTKGALLTRGLAEMMRLGKAMGAKEETFSGLTGIGDLITTAISKHSRNRKFGEMIGAGIPTAEALKRMVMVAEGVESTKSVHALALKYEIEMPITEQLFLTLFENKPVKEAARDLMLRESKPERW